MKESSILSLNYWTLQEQGQASNRGGEVTQLGFQLWSPQYLKVELSTIHTTEHKLVNTLVHTVPGMLPNPDEGHCAEHLHLSHGPFLFLHLCTLSFPKAFICSQFLFSASSLYSTICQKLLAQIYPFLKLCSFSKHANLTIPMAFTGVLFLTLLRGSNTCIYKMDTFN